MCSKITIVIGFVLWALNVQAHEMTPAYPKLRPSYIKNVYITELKIFNRRTDVEYYSIDVFDNKWKPVAFASPNKVIRLKTNKYKTFEVYIRSIDVDKITYICTTSKLFKSKEQVTLVSSRICSKIKK
jgi:hypothetical protein